MAMTASLSMPYNPIVNQAVQFTLLVQNTGAAAVNIQSVSPQVKCPSGAPVPAAAASVSPVFVAPGTALAQTGGSQLNIPVPGQVGSTPGSISLTMQGIFFGPTMPGGPTQPNMAYVVTADIMFSDGTIAQAGGIICTPSQPMNGKATWIETKGAGSQPPTGSLDFSDPLSSSLLL